MFLSVFRLPALLLVIAAALMTAAGCGGNTGKHGGSVPIITYASSRVSTGTDTVLYVRINNTGPRCSLQNLLTTAEGWMNSGVVPRQDEYGAGMAAALRAAEKPGATCAQVRTRLRQTLQRG